MLDPERRPSTKLICEQNQNTKFTRPGPSTQLRGLERHGQFLLLSAQLHLPLVQVDGKAEDIVDFPRCDLQRFPSPTVPAAAPWPIKRPAVGLISDAYIIDFATHEICTEPTQLRAVELAQDLDFMIKLASVLGQVWGTAGEPNVAVRRCSDGFKAVSPTSWAQGRGGHLPAATHQSRGH